MTTMIYLLVAEMMNLKLVAAAKNGKSRVVAGYASEMTPKRPVWPETNKRS